LKALAGRVIPAPEYPQNAKESLHKGAHGTQTLYMTANT
jgi:hypothetical protein